MAMQLSKRDHNVEAHTLLDTAFRTFVDGIDLPELTAARVQLENICL